jgi:threonylcarbamoyladenosine tRNA methylthiotransferase MtaB
MTETATLQGSQDSAPSACSKSELPDVGAYSGAGSRVVTLGCRVNGFESEVMKHHAIAAGLDDAIIVNTCAVTAEAVRQAAQTVRRLRRDHPTARLIVTGCAAQIEPERFAAMAEVDHVIGNKDKLRAETFAALATNATQRLIIDDIMSVRETAAHLVDGFDGRTRAYVQVQNGCDHRCTFCIIPFGRGPSRSVPAGEVVQQIRRLVEHGTKEIILTGIDMTSYGPDLPGSLTLGKLARLILRHVPDLPRLRLSSIDQVEVDQDLLSALAEEPRFMPHLHLSLQAGADLILKRMKRRHLRHHAIEFCALARRLRPDIVFGADFIAGFPTETNDHFNETLDLVEACGLTYLHVFPFSPRKGTPAARMPQTPRAEIKARAARLRVAGAVRLEGYLASQVGATHDVLIENGGIGRTTAFTEVRFPTQVHFGQPGTIHKVRMIGHTATHLVGSQVHGEATP